MFLEIVTLCVLGTALVTKWATSRSAQGMVREKTELENEYHKMRNDYNALFEKRKASEEAYQTGRSRDHRSGKKSGGHQARPGGADRAERGSGRLTGTVMERTRETRRKRVGPLFCSTTE